MKVGQKNMTPASRLHPLARTGKWLESWRQVLWLVAQENEIVSSSPSVHKSIYMLVLFFCSTGLIFRCSIECIWDSLLD